ncbi:MAG: transglycosylase SLT domain-containing protein [Solirubrobacteraceae bacterium]
MAWVNGIDPAGVLLVGTVLKLPADAPALTRATAPAAAAPQVVPTAAPEPTPGILGAERVKRLAAEQGAPASLAAAIAWQESGFNNAMLSSANARGVMQVMPARGTGSGPTSPPER